MAISQQPTEEQLAQNSPDVHSLPIRERLDLSALEKETHIQFNKGDEQATMETEIGCHMRQLRAHPHFTLTDYRTTVIDSELHIVRVNGVLPIGCISVTSSPRKDSSLRNVVSNSVLKDSRQCNVDFDYSWSFDPGTYHEQETTMRMAKDLDTVNVWSSENGISNRLGAHPEYDGELPVGCLTIKSKPRKGNDHVSVVTSSVL